MRAVDQTARRYDRRTIFFHWLTFFLVVAQFALAWTIDDFPNGPLRVDARSIHIALGALLAVVLVARLVWRGTGGRRLPPSEGGALHVLAKATHWGLYLVLLAMVSAGFFLVWARGDSLFNLVTVPRFDPSNNAVRHQAQELHATIGWVIIALVGFHALAAIVHRVFWKDGVLSRMAPHAAGAAGQD